MCRAQSSDRLLKFIGASPLPSAKPWIPASDFSGVVHSAGSSSGWSVGEEIYGMKPLSPMNGEKAYC
jgi:NADPH:quinone reductase-like Zn-dependent oxidoreductase